MQTGVEILTKKKLPIERNLITITWIKALIIGFISSRNKTLTNKNESLIDRLTIYRREILMSYSIPLFIHDLHTIINSEETCHQGFLVILKRTLENLEEIFSLKHMDSDVISSFNFQPHTSVIPVAKGLTNDLNNV